MDVIVSGSGKYDFSYKKNKYSAIKKQGKKKKQKQVQFKCNFSLLLDAIIREKMVILSWELHDIFDIELKTKTSKAFYNRECKLWEVYYN